MSLLPLSSEGLEKLVEWLKLNHKKLVVLGEGSHGTHEFQMIRGLLSRQLLTNEESPPRFRWVCVEWDWPDMWKLNLYVKNVSTNTSASQLLKQVSRWPYWMYAHEELAAFAEWLRSHNASLPFEQKIGLYGMDLFGLAHALRNLLDYLKRQGDQQKAVHVLTSLYGECTAPPNNDQKLTNFCSSTLLSAGAPASFALVRQTLQKMQPLLTSPEAHEDFLNAQMSLQTLQSSIRHLQTSRDKWPKGWNTREAHMAHVASLLFDRFGPGILWTHNVHAADERFGDPQASKQTVSFGTLLRNRFGWHQVCLIGMATLSGSVLASHKWNGPTRVMSVHPCPPTSWEVLIDGLTQRHAAILLLEEMRPKLKDLLQTQLLQRNIGAQYMSEHEFWPTRLFQRFDVLIYIPSTTPTHPLRLDH